MWHAILDSVLVGTFFCTPQGVGLDCGPSSQARLAGAAPHDLQAPGAAAFEELIGIDLIAPAQEVRLGVVLGRAKDGEALLGLLGDRPPLELFEATLRFLGCWPFHVAPRHRAEPKSSRSRPRAGPGDR